MTYESYAKQFPQVVRWIAQDVTGMHPESQEDSLGWFEIGHRLFLDKLDAAYLAGVRHGADGLAVDEAAQALRRRNWLRNDEGQRDMNRLRKYLS